MEKIVKKITRTFEGKVVSNKGDKTVVISVQRTKLHALYQKRFIVSRKYQVHDPRNAFNVGDEVTFVECRPLSRHKRWMVVYPEKKA